MYEHWKQVEKTTGVKIVRLHPRIPFDFMMTRALIRSRYDRPDEGVKRGEVYQVGYSWPHATRRWCTRLKCDALEMFRRHHFPDCASAIGFAAGEECRTKSGNQQERTGRGEVVYPLIEAGITEAECLERCYGLGYHWGGLYEHFNRLSCYLCPLQGLRGVRAVRSLRPGLWRHMLELDAAIQRNNGFDHGRTLAELDKLFAAKEVEEESCSPTSS